MVGTLTILPNLVRVELGVMVMKRYPTFTKAPGLEPHHQVQDGNVICVTVIVERNGFSELSLIPERDYLRFTWHPCP